MPHSQYSTLEFFIGNTPLVQLQRLPGSTRNLILGKLEGNNPAGSVKDRPALSMIQQAEKRGALRAGEVLIEATSGNTGIALAMIAAMKGYRLMLVMPENQSAERRAAMRAYGAELILVSQEEGMEGARDLATRLEREGRGRVLDQFGNPDNPLAHYQTTGPEIWRDTHGQITHFVSAMGTTGTIMGVSRYLKERNPAVQIVGVQPTEGSFIAGIRRWPLEYLPKIYEPARNICQKFTSRHEWTESSMSSKWKQSTLPAGWPAKRAFAAAYRRAGRWRRRCGCRRRLRTR